MRIYNNSKDKLNNSYLKILNLVKNGVTIQNACKTSNITTSLLYKYLTKEQKRELRFYKTTTLAYGCNGSITGKSYLMSEFMTLEYNDDFE